MMTRAPVDTDEHLVDRRDDRVNGVHRPDPSSLRSPPGRPGWTLISVLEARLPLASSEPAAAGRDGSAAGPRGSRCQGPLPAAEVTDGNLPSRADVSR